MFDLFRSRDKAVRILLGGLLGIVALSMLLYLIPGAGMQSADRNDQVVAEVGKDAVTIQDIDRDLQNKVRGRQIPPDVVGVLIQQEIDNMVAERATAYEASRMGLQVSDSELANAIRSLPNVGTLPPDQYRDFLAQQGFSVEEFENNMRKQVLITSLVNMAVADGVIVTPAEIEKEYRRGFEKVRLEYVSFLSEKLKPEIKAGADQLKAYFQGHRGFFSVPEGRTFQVLAADPMKMAETLQVSDAQIQQYYDSHKDSYRTPERVKARHILFKTTEKSKDEIAKIKSQAEDVLKQIKGGADFAKLAEKYSEDPGSAKTGGDLGWVVRGQTVRNFEATAFSLKPKEISDLVTTEYGFHIIQVQEKQDARLQPLDETLKPVIASALKGQMVNEKMQTVADQARAELAKAPQNAEQIAAKFGLQLVSVDNHKPGDAISGLGVDAPLDAAVQGLKKGEVSEVTQSGSRLEMAVLTNVVASHPAEFGDVEAQVRNLYLRDESVRLANDKARQASEMLKGNGGDLAAIGKKLGGDVKTTDEFTRGGAAEGLGSAAQLADAFDRPVGGTLGPLTIGGQVIVAKVVAKVEPDMTKLAAQRDTLLQQLKSKKAQERLELFQDSLVSKLSQEGKIKIHKDVMNRLISRYRS